MEILHRAQMGQDACIYGIRTDQTYIHIPRIAVPFERRVFRGYVTSFTKLFTAREDSRKLHDVDYAEIRKRSNTFA